MSKSFNYANREFTLDNIIEGGKLLRTVINDGGLEFPFPNYEKASDFLADEYGGSTEAAFAVLSETESLEGIEVSGTPAKVAPDKKGKKAGKKKEKAPKKEKGPKVEKAPKEIIERTFELPGKSVTKKIQIKTVVPGQVPESVEDVMLDPIYALHIDIYSKKNRTTTLTNTETSEVVITNVSLLDAIYAYAEKVGMTFPQADKYIKIKRGLLPAPEKKTKKEKMKATDLKSEPSPEETEAPKAE